MRKWQGLNQESVSVMTGQNKELCPRHCCNLLDNVVLSVIIHTLSNFTFFVKKLQISIEVDGDPSEDNTVCSKCNNDKHRLLFLWKLNFLYCFQNLANMLLSFAEMRTFYLAYDKKDQSYSAFMDNQSLFYSILRYLHEVNSWAFIPEGMTGNGKYLRIWSKILIEKG